MISGSVALVRSLLEDALIDELDSVPTAMRLGCPPLCLGSVT